MDKASVIIPTYKRHHNISKVVKNVLLQDYPNFEILIIDDNGIGTSDQIETHKALLPLLQQYKNIRYICLESNSGACNARNKGIKEASGYYVAFLDDDDYWHPSFLSDMIATLIANNTDVAYSNFYRMDKHGIFFNKKEKFHDGNVRNELLMGWCPATTSLFCIKKSLLINNGGFDNKLKNLEEYDLWIRLSGNSKFSFCEKYLVIKNESEHEQLTNNYDSRIQAWRDMKGLWGMRDLSPSQKQQFFNVIDENILLDCYHKDFQSISTNHKLNKSKYNIKKFLLLSGAQFFGVNIVIFVKYFVTRYFGPICYLTKSQKNNIKKKFQINFI